MKKMLLLFMIFSTLVSCKLFEDDKAESTSNSSGSFSSISCEDFEARVDTTVESDYGVTVSCDNQVLSAVGTGLSASFSSSCLGASVTIEATDIDLGVDFSDIEYNETTEEIRGDLGIDYNVTVGTITELPNVTDIDCDIELAMDIETEEPSLENFRGFTCTYTYDGQSETISHTDVVAFAALIEADPDCDATSLSKNEEIHLAVKK